jgi:SAM-dependent methyltransferase
MVERARERAGFDADVHVADARDLPVLGSFDLVTCIGDALNYLLSEEELGMAFRGVARNLRPGGLFAFDLNTLACYRTHFMQDSAAEVDGTFFYWRGEATPEDIEPGAVLSAVIEVFAGGAEDRRYLCSSRHVQRHHPPVLVERLLDDAGLELVDRRGQLGADTDPGGDDDVHMKLDYFARRSERTPDGVGGGDGA